MRTDAFQRRDRGALVARTLLAVFGGYTACWGVIALCAAASLPLGAEFHDGEMLGSILALLAYPVVFLWAFAARSLWRAGTVLVGGGALMAAVAALIQLSVS